MKISEFINILKMSSLKGLAVGSTTEKIEETNLQILSWINRSLIKLYGDLNLSQGGKRFYIEFDNNEYQLPREALNIIAVKNYMNVDIPINKSDREDSVYTPEPHLLMVPDCFVGEYIDVFYIKAPDLVTSLDEDLPVGVQFVEALVLYISYIANELIHSLPNWEHQSYLTKYKAELEDLKRNGLITNRGVINQKIYQKGFI